MAIRNSVLTPCLAALILAAVPSVSKADFNTMPGGACVPTILGTDMNWRTTGGGAFKNENGVAKFVHCALSREKANSAPLKRVEVSVTGGVSCQVVTSTASGDIVQLTSSKTETRTVKKLVFTNVQTVARGTATVSCFLQPDATLNSVVWIE